MKRDNLHRALRQGVFGAKDLVGKCYNNLPIQDMNRLWDLRHLLREALRGDDEHTTNIPFKGVA